MQITAEGEERTQRSAIGSSFWTGDTHVITCLTQFTLHLMHLTLLQPVPGLLVVVVVVVAGRRQEATRMGNSKCLLPLET
jgi:hypothetical protein